MIVSHRVGGGGIHPSPMGYIYIYIYMCKRLYIYKRKMQEMVIRKNREDIKHKKRRGEENTSREKVGEDQNAIGAGFIVTTQTLPENENQAWKQTIPQNPISRQHYDPKNNAYPPDRPKSSKSIKHHPAPANTIQNQYKRTSP